MNILKKLLFLSITIMTFSVLASEDYLVDEQSGLIFDVAISKNKDKSPKESEVAKSRVIEKKTEVPIPMVSQETLSAIKNRVTQRLNDVEKLFFERKYGESRSLARSIVIEIEEKAKISSKTPQIYVLSNLLTLWPNIFDEFSKLPLMTQTIFSNFIKNQQDGFFLDLLNIAKRATVLYMKSHLKQRLMSDKPKKNDINYFKSELLKIHSIPIYFIPDGSSYKDVRIFFDKDVVDKNIQYEFNNEILDMALESKLWDTEKAFDKDLEIFEKNILDGNLKKFLISSNVDKGRTPFYGSITSTTDVTFDVRCDYHQWNDKRIYIYPQKQSSNITCIPLGARLKKTLQEKCNETLPAHKNNMWSQIFSTYTFSSNQLLLIDSVYFTAKNEVVFYNQSEPIFSCSSEISNASEGGFKLLSKILSLNDNLKFNLMYPKSLEDLISIHNKIINKNRFKDASTSTDYSNISMKADIVPDNNIWSNTEIFKNVFEKITSIRFSKNDLDEIKSSIEYGDKIPFFGNIGPARNDITYGIQDYFSHYPTRMDESMITCELRGNTEKALSKKTKSYREYIVFTSISFESKNTIIFHNNDGEVFSCSSQDSPNFEEGFNLLAKLLTLDNRLKFEFMVYGD